MDNEIHKYDQSFEFFLRVLPSSLRSFYSKLKEEGFSEKESLELTKEWLKSISTFK